MSVCSKEYLDQALDGIPCWLIAESGVASRESRKGSLWQETPVGTEWKGPVKKVMDYFSARTPGTTVYETAFSVSWCYEKTLGDHAGIQMKDLLIHLWAGPLSNAPAEVVVGYNCVIVRSTVVSLSSQLETTLRRICCEDGNKKPDAWLK